MPPTSGHIEFIARGLIVVRGHVLLCWSRKGDYGYLPGGHIETDEGAGAALEREMVEETGLVCRAGPLLLVHENRFVVKKRGHHEVNLVFAAKITDRAFRKSEREMCHVAQRGKAPIARRQRGGVDDDEPSAPPLVTSKERHLEFRWMTPAAMKKATVYPEPMAQWAATLVAAGLGSTEGLVGSAGVPSAEWLSTGW